MTNSRTQAPGDEEIRELIADLEKAVCRKDIDAVMAHYADEVVVFNVRPPFEIRGKQDWRHEWEFAVSHFPESFGYQIKDLAVERNGEIASVHYRFRYTAMPFPSSWIRNTAVFKTVGGRWQIVHEHFSLPFDPETSKVVFDFGE